MKKSFGLCLLLLASVACADKADFVLVDKSDGKLWLYSNGSAYREFNVVFGANPVGHKQQEGDERTPEGHYVLDYKNENSDFYRSIRISYPNETDLLRAYINGVDPGGQIMIHGQRNGVGWAAALSQQVNWTDGCIAVTNKEMDEIWRAVDVGTPIEIIP